VLGERSEKFIFSSLFAGAVALYELALVSTINERKTARRVCGKKESIFFKSSLFFLSPPFEALFFSL
jgi:hypothetical protein